MTPEEHARSLGLIYIDPATGQRSSPTGPAASAPQLPTPDFYAIANSQGQNSPAQAAAPPMASPPTSAPQMPSAGSAAPPSGAPPQLPPATAPQIQQGPGAMFNIPQPSAPSTAPSIAAAPTFHPASPRPAMPQFNANNLSPIRPYSPAPTMPGYGEARAGHSFIGAPQIPGAGSIPGLNPAAGLTAGIGGDTSVPFNGDMGMGIGGFGSLFSQPAPMPDQQQIDPSLYGQFSMPRNFQ